MTPPAPVPLIRDDVLHLGAAPTLHLFPGWSVVEDATGAGVFLRARAAEPASYFELPLGRIVGLERFTSCHRYSPFWTRPAIGRDESDVRPETLWLLADTGDAAYTMIVPLIDDTTRYSLRSGLGALVLAAETGDPAVTSEGGVALFVARGSDPHALAAEGARAVQRFLGTGRLRVDKPLPDFVDLFGWCTWDAFYKEVSADQVLEGLAAFASGGVEPRLLILDDGWQTWRRAASGEDRLTSLAPNERFGGDLGALVHEAKARFGVRRFLVWHAMLGYWGGLCETSLPGYGTRSVGRSFGPGLLEQEPRWNVGPWGAQLGVPSAAGIGAFHDDLHARLARQGVDGVKVDVQAMVEGVAAGQGGRVALSLACRRALEGSVMRHFGGRLINCMSCTSECAYLATDSTLVRTSDDFFPDSPESHGRHLHANAVAGLWFGEFMQPDWDMFQSSHERGAFHAAARAVSGGQVYVSDKPGAHDFALLRKLVLSDGSVLRADHPGRPTLDSLFVDPATQPALLKIFNANRDCGVVGLFNARHDAADGEAIEGDVGPGDVPLLRRGDYAAFAHRGDRVWRCAFGERAPVRLCTGEWELVSYAPIENGFGALGLGDKFNSTGAIERRAWRDGRCHLALRDGGRFLAWAEREPSIVLCDGQALAFTYDPGTCRLDADVPAGGARELVVQWR